MLRQIVARRGVAEAWVAACLASMMIAAAAFGTVDRRADRLAREAADRPRGLVEILPEPGYRYDAPPSIRVRLGRFRQRITIESSGVDAAVADVVGGAEAQRIPAIKLFRLELASGALKFSPDDGAPVTFRPGEAVRITPAGRRNWMRLAQRRVEGSVVIRPHAGRGDDPGYFEVVAEMPIEQYLPGVLHGELFASWSDDAYRAQAVAARSYALHEMEQSRQRGLSFDLEASQVDQAYAGTDVPRRALEAAEATRGLVLETSDGEMLRAYYSSTCGGRAASAAEIWPSAGRLAFNRAQPLQPIAEEDGGWAPGDCPCSTPPNTAPLHRWQVERPTSRFAERLRAWGTNAAHPVAKLGTLVSIEPIQTNAMGRPDHYRISDEAGKHADMLADDLRVACNFSKGRLSPPGRKDRVQSNDLNFQFLDKSVLIRGRGFGHGVGLCQYGAEGLARDGWRWRQIVERAYPSARLVRAYP
ncbi:MAG: SpoIID/LytB domain-containing protein [Planctomycetota bacterium]